MAAFNERARRRAGWPSKLTTLTAADAPRGPTNASDAWHAVLELTREAWSLTGETVRLPRSQWPSRVYAPGEVRPDTHGR